MPVTTRTKFFIGKVRDHYKKELYANVVDAMNFASAKCKELVGRPGAAPSKPGEAPRKVTGELQRSIKAHVEIQKDGVAGYLSAGTEYALRLEFGYVGTDSRGRKINQAPRPFLRRTIAENRREIYKRVTKPVK